MPQRARGPVPELTAAEREPGSSRHGHSSRRGHRHSGGRGGGRLRRGGRRGSGGRCGRRGRGRASHGELDLALPEDLHRNGNDDRLGVLASKHLHRKAGSRGKLDHQLGAVVRSRVSALQQCAMGRMGGNHALHDVRPLSLQLARIGDGRRQRSRGRRGGRRSRLRRNGRRCAYRGGGGTRRRGGCRLLGLGRLLGLHRGGRRRGRGLGGSGL